ncbi:YggU family protein [bacterium]|nr:YggU family protein [bacterium]
MFLKVRATPNGSKSEVLGMNSEGLLRIRLKAPAVEGKANKELIRFLSQILGLKRGDLRILRGEKSRIKVLELPGSREKILQMLGVES